MVADGAVLGKPTRSMRDFQNPALSRGGYSDFSDSALLNEVAIKRLRFYHNPDDTCDLRDMNLPPVMFSFLFNRLCG
jgi:hypothetical protein